MIIEEIRDALRESADEKYKDFNSSLIPGETILMIGVRMPRLREVAKKIAKEQGREYIEALCQAEKRGAVYHEELLLHGMVIGYLKCSNEERMALLDNFIPKIRNWAVCDSSCMTYKFMKKDSEEWFTYLMKYTDSKSEYELRFAVVAMLDHFVTEPFIDRVLEVMGRISHEGYYVKMAAAWAVSVCYIKFREKTEELLQSQKLDDFTQNKSIQKIRESYRVSKEEKEALLQWKRQ